MPLTAVDYAILSLCYEYLMDTGFKYITYDGLTGYAKAKKKIRYKNETLQKAMRNLAIAGFFTRHYVPSPNNPRSKTVHFYPTRSFYEFFNRQRA